LLIDGEEYCEPIEPDILIWHWVVNDPENNSFLADRHSGPNNARPRPYFEDDEITIRRPYPVHITDSIDSMMTIKMLNGLILRTTAAPKEVQHQYKEIGWEVAEIMISRVARDVKKPIALIEDNEPRAIDMFKRQGFEVAIYGAFPEEHMCKPKDHHPNTKGHQQMLEALLPLLEEQLSTE